MACPDRLDRALSLLLPPAFWLGVWQLGAWLVELHVEGRGNELLLPYPATVLLALFRLARSPEFWWTALASLARIAAGMAGGAVLGGLLAALTCTSPWCRRLFALGSSGPRRWSPSSCWCCCGPAGTRCLR